MQFYSGQITGVVAIPEALMYPVDKMPSEDKVTFTPVSSAWFNLFIVKVIVGQGVDTTSILES